jgi:hypothetical protein
VPHYLYTGLTDLEHWWHQGVIHPGDTVELPETDHPNFEPVEAPAEPVAEPVAEPEPVAEEPAAPTEGN